MGPHSFLGQGCKDWLKHDKCESRYRYGEAGIKNAFKQRRCLIPADGFYEWKKIGADKQPYRIMLKDEKIFSMAGLWKTRTSPEGNKISSCTIITTDPNELMVDIHDRMPMILSREGEQKWLDKN